MKYLFPEINNVFDTEIDKVNTIIIENPQLFFDVISDIAYQIDGADGKSVLSKDNTVIRFDKNCDLLDRFVPFSFNQKALITKIASSLEKRANDGENYIKLEELLASIERFFYDISIDMSGDIEFNHMTASSLIKASEFRLNDDYDSLAEKIIDYMELVKEYLGEKLFVTVGLRSFLSDNEAELFLQTILQHGFHCIMIESFLKEKLMNEKRYIIDEDLCEIC